MPTNTPLTPQQIDTALQAVQSAFRQVRPLILSRAGKVDHTDKADGSPVTDTDVEVEEAIKAGLLRDIPNIPVYGEEGGYDGNLPDTFWLIDPIDGTKSFIENIPAFTSMAVIIQNGEAIASAIYNISRDDMYIASKGRGAYKNGVRLDLANVPLPNIAFCKERFSPALNAMLASKQVSCQAGPSGGGYGFTLVLDGASAARFNMLGGGYTHDYAPGALLVQEAGGVIIPIQDDVYTYETRSFAACHPEIAPILEAHRTELRSLETNLAD
jgi:fructose-1,6-bisphosphatase/inositol monophosphatase family enzyme